MGGIFEAKGIFRARDKKIIGKHMYKLHKTYAGKGSKQEAERGARTLKAMGYLATVRRRASTKGFVYDLWKCKMGSADYYLHNYSLLA